MGAFASGLAGGLTGSGSPKQEKVDAAKLEEPKAVPSEYEHGGKVRKTGRAKVHKGERVLTKRQARKYEKRKRARK